MAPHLGYTRVSTNWPFNPHSQWLRGAFALLNAMGPLYLLSETDEIEIYEGL